MNHNPNIPQLFRNIFKNAYLPYRDPETLKSFLKEINVFTYDHSERLGDAFEYLLSVLGSQGDAGQFRTPRHIIDFIVEVVQPTKNDIILDPACGTAGFLISAYKHILKRNTKDGKSQLLPDERTRLMNNFSGYDISPDMVRLSLVNLYLHLFSDPKIYEYDTLTSEDRWNDTADVILANPPFMTPKGGIRPHKRFSVQANRSEVLFVDYIAEHLNPGGRAGVIVPEGIIFQSSNAYKRLRKMLVEDYLWAVVSLPAGIFQPYSGVKTSILLMDKAIAKKTDKLLFVKIDNDGFGLGAQRRPIEKNDLPQALKYIRDYKESLHSGREIEPVHLAHLVEKSKIAESGDWNLSGEMYKADINPISINYDEVELDSVVEIMDRLRKPITKSDRVFGKYPYYGATGIVDYVNEYIFDERLVLVGEDGAKWSVNDSTAFIADGKYWVNNHAHVLKPNKDKLIDTYLVKVLNALDLNRYITGITVPKLNQEKLRSIKIPLPPLSVQQEIVAEIDGYQKIIDGARQVVDNYKPTIKINPDWEMVELGEICEVTSSKRIYQNEYVQSGIPFYRTKEVVERSKGKSISVELFIPKDRYDEIKRKYDVPQKGEILITAVGTIGLTWIIPNNDEFYFKDGNLIWLKNINNTNPVYLKFALDITFNKILAANIYGAAYKALTIVKLKQFKIPLPSLIVQQEIVAKIEAEQEMVTTTKKLIEIYEQKIRDKIAEVWGE